MVVYASKYGGVLLLLVYNGIIRLVLAGISIYCFYYVYIIRNVRYSLLQEEICVVASYAQPYAALWFNYTSLFIPCIPIEIYKLFTYKDC